MSRQLRPSAGRPVVIGDLGGQAEYVDDAVGRLVHEQTPESYADAVESVNSRLRDAPAEHFAERVAERFSGMPCAGGTEPPTRSRSRAGLPGGLHVLAGGRDQPWDGDLVEHSSVRRPPSNRPWIVLGLCLGRPSASSLACSQQRSGRRHSVSVLADAFASSGRCAW